MLWTTGHVTYFTIQEDLVSQSLKTEGPPEVPASRKYFAREKMPSSHMYYMQQIRDLLNHYVFNRKSNGPWGQAVEAGVTPPTITLSDSPGVCGLHRVRGPTPQKGHTVAKGQSKDPTEPRAIIALGTLNSPCFKTRRQGKSYGLGRAVAPNQPVEVPAFVEWREGGIHMELNFLLHLLALPCPVITVDGHVQ